MWLMVIRRDFAGGRETSAYQQRRNMRVYVVTTKNGDGTTERLVRAPTAAQAIRHVAKPMFVAEVASQEDCLRLAKTHDIEDAGENGTQPE